MGTLKRHYPQHRTATANPRENEATGQDVWDFADALGVAVLNGTPV